MATVILSRGALSEFIENGDLATKARQIFLQKYRDWAQWQANPRRKTA